MSKREDLIKTFTIEQLADMYLEKCREDSDKTQPQEVQIHRAEDSPSAYQRYRDFAYFPPRRYFLGLQELAEEIAQEEPWCFRDNKGNKYAILENYLYYTFKKLEDEDKICYGPNNKYAIFNTGLLTSSLEGIFAYFIENESAKYKKKLPFCFRAFIKASDARLDKFSQTPQRANYFRDSYNFIFDPKFELRPKIDHIIEDEKNVKRLPEHFQNLPKDELRRKLVGAIDSTKQRLCANYALALPNYYSNQKTGLKTSGIIQLLIPLYLISDSGYPDLAMALSANYGARVYTGRTCLTLKMAYQNVRCIRKLEGTWLYNALFPNKLESEDLD